MTSIQVENVGAVDQVAEALAFGQVFAPGHLRADQGVLGILPDGTRLPMQLDVKARHADGSVRHAILAATIPRIAAGQSQKIGLATTAAAPATGSVTPAQLLAAGFQAGVNVSLNGEVYGASADALLKSGKYSNWITGPVIAEWLVSAPLATAQGKVHPHLSARFAIRASNGARKARVDVTLENDWAYEPAPQNFTYDATVTVANKVVLAKTGLTHYHHARWRTLAWWGDAPQLEVKHDAAYLIASKAVPHYDSSLVIGETTLAAMDGGWTGAKTEPMGTGEAVSYMPTTGGRPDIGLLPSWNAIYLLSMDRRARKVAFGTADLAGSWSAHYRDRNTDRPVSLQDFPYMTILGHVGDTYNPATRKQEAFPPCAAEAACASPNVHDSSHQPGFAYLPYLLTGDYYYLEELQFWAMWNAFSSNPGYRDNIQGLLKPDQVRGQAWSLRSVSEAAYITPDGDRLKAHFETLVSNNLDWYNATYTNNPAANTLGIIVNGYALVYDNGVGMAPWMDDFFTAAVGHAAELGFDKAKPLLAWKARFPIDRMSAPGACWIDAAIYSLKVRDDAASPLYPSLGQAYAASHSAEFTALPCAGKEMADSLKLKVGEMTGYSSSAAGYPSNMQPALAYSADAGGAAGARAWQTFIGRSVEPDYALQPQFAIVPR